MKAIEKLLEISRVGSLLHSTATEKMDDEARALELVCLHHRLGLLVNSYSQQRAHEEARDRAPLAIARP